MNEIEGKEANETIIQEKKGIQLDVTALTGEKSFVNISINPNIDEDYKRNGVNICLCIDVSGSMGSEATVNSGNGKEGFGLSLLDLVKHAGHTVIESLSDNDNLSIVSFTSSSQLVFKTTKMTKPNKKKALFKLKGLKPDSMTNLYSGITESIKELDTLPLDGTNSCIIVLTDGVSNQNPPRGVLPTYERLQAKRIKDGKLSPILHTFGFGYSLQSELLSTLSNKSNGIYSFIPDSGFIGTIFVNSLSQILTTVSKDCVLKIKCRNGAILGQNSAFNFVSKTKDSCVINVGTLHAGQNRDICLQVDLPEGNQSYIDAEFQYKTVDGNAKNNTIKKVGSDVSDDSTYTLKSVLRTKAVEAIKTAAGIADNKAKALVKNVIKEIEESDVKGDDAMKGLVKDLKGQVTEAIATSTAHKKWGAHYLLSLYQAHFNQYCNNFKDPGVQFYGGKMFRNIQDEVDELFCSLPPPKPTIKKVVHNYGSNSSNAKPKKKLNFKKVFHSSNNVCFDGGCIVQMSDGKSKRVDSIVKGDVVKTCKGFSKVTCVLKTILEDNKAILVQLKSGLKVTPWHPIRIGNKWHFPYDLAPVDEFDCDAVYNFVLEQGHTMFINGVECCTLGHNFKEDVVRHRYFGTQAIVNDLKKFHGYENGKVLLKSGALTRTRPKGHVDGLLQSKVIVY